MARRKSKKQEVLVNKTFHLEFLSPAQNLAWEVFQKHDIIFLLGVAGTGKSHLAVAFGIHELLYNGKKKLVLTRPVVESGKSLGFLPGEFTEKMHPYMLPLYDCMDKLCGTNTQRNLVNQQCEIAPINYLRGRTFDDCVCILDEAQNCTLTELILFLTRMGEGSKLIITGDPRQSDIHCADLENTAEKLSRVKGVGVIQFKENSIVRHPLVAKILSKLM